MKATDIEWDCSKSELDYLPSEIEIPAEIENDEEEISDFLSETTGFCHYGYCLQE